jgi:hypothetical protein
MGGDPHRPCARWAARPVPGVPLWYGRYTQHIWCLVKDRAGRDHLVEVIDLAEFERLLDALYARPVQRSTPGRPGMVADARARPPLAPGSRSGAHASAGGTRRARLRRSWWRRLFDVPTVREAR